MPSKSTNEKNRLSMASQAQSILMQQAIKSKPVNESIKQSNTGDSYEPAGEVDYTKYTKIKK